MAVPRPESRCLHQRELRQCRHAIVQADFLDDLAILEAQHGRAGEKHFPAGGCWRRADEKVAEGGPDMRTAPFPAASNVIPVREKVGDAREIKVRKASVFAGATISSTISRLHILPQKAVNQRPTMALLSLSLDILNSSIGCIDERKAATRPLSQQYPGERSEALRSFG